MGFMCYVCGRMDLSDFFCGMQLGFDAAPPLSTLKRSIEDRLAADASVGDGVTFSVRELEILDLRLNMWVPLDGRQQLYSGCHIAAVRDTASASSAGPVDVLHRNGNEQATLTFAMDAQRLFDALDADHTAVVTLQGMLRVLRHDPNYCIDLFALIDRRVAGQVSFADFMTAYHEKPQAFWRELQQRLQHGGALPSGGRARFDPATGTTSPGVSSPTNGTPRGSFVAPNGLASASGGQGMPPVPMPTAHAAVKEDDEETVEPMAPENQERARRVVSAFQKTLARRAGSDAASSASPPASSVGQRLLLAARRMKAKSAGGASVSGTIAPAPASGASAMGGASSLAGAANIRPAPKKT